MPPFRVRPPGVRHQLEMQFRRMNLPNWPPADASPLHPIEPWGKQFFVFNALKSQKFPSDRRWGQYQAAPLQEVDGTILPDETVLCVTDFARSPLMFLSHEDFTALVGYLPELKKHFEKLKAEQSNENELESIIYKSSRLHQPARHYGMQRMPGGNHTSYGMKRGTNRERKR
ncbi:hypothetical protein IE077_002128 [Cardiosporidium cionae]|uniref:Cyclic nucleotide-binding domain-containing protein n=1 Tax=Cardiosporidium cionae TaxID=476202 RepID=A0ABQ7JCI3_9APIC|nr:hypothetical protein IE077_002128 [Cardiosporidium cionae]|eukprot:KAF8821350.1 hypothetical protein IE077_002128 [Cardiosporidium cionae]